MDDLTSTQGIVALGAAGLAFAALVLAAIASIRLRRVRADQQAVLGHAGSTDLVSHAAAIERDFEALHAYVAEIAQRLDGRLGTVEERLDGTIAYRGLVRFDATELSGRQSCSIALLDATRSGIVLSSIHHRDQARLYAKYVRDGVGEIALSPEEDEALRLALAGEPPPEPV